MVNDTLYVALENSKELKKLLEELYEEANKMRDLMSKLRYFEIKLKIVAEDEVKDILNITCDQFEEPQQ